MSAPATKSAVTCPVTRDEFLACAKPLQVVVAGVPMLLDPRVFSTGSLGFYGGGKAAVDVNGTLVKCQVSITITAIGSKPQ